MRFHVPRFLSPFQPSPELVGHSGSTGSFLYYCKEFDLYMAGTINEFSLRSAPFRLMLKVANAFRRFRVVGCMVLPAQCWGPAKSSRT